MIFFDSDMIILCGIRSSEKIIVILSMNTTIIFKLEAKKFYNTHLGKSDYADFAIAEKEELYEELRKDKFKKCFMNFISNSGDYHGDAELHDSSIYESDGDIFMKALTTFTNPDNYTARRMKSIITDNNNHHYQAGEYQYGSAYYYQYTDAYEEIDKKQFGVYDPQYPTINDVIIFDDNTHKDTKTDRNRISLCIHDIIIDNADLFDKNGSDLVKFQRTCEHHKYYYYIYDTNSGDLIESACASGDTPDIESIKEIFNHRAGNYMYVTDNLHNIIYEEKR